MKVSIIIPVYNIEKYIIRCIESVAHQTWTGDIECIFVDDCGRDDSVNIINNWLDSYNGRIVFKLIHHEQNRGLSGARNTGINEASGNYIYFLDGDDAITSDCVDTLIKLANKYPKADFVQGNLLDDTLHKSHYAFRDIPEYSESKTELESLMLSQLVTSACNRLIKREFILKHCLFFTEGIVHEDMNWIYFFSRHVNAAAFSTKGTYIYYTNDSSIMTSTSPSMHIRRYQSRLVSSTAYINDLKENSGSSYRRMYIGVNLLSCLTELIPLQSLKHWCKFWRYILYQTIRNISRATIPRFLFLIMLLPPLCFFSGKQRYRWRVQRRIVNKL